MFAIAVRALVAVLFVGALAACASSPYSPSGANALDTSDSISSAAGATSCRSLFIAILMRERSGDTTGAINAELDELGDRCPGRYQVFVDYVSIKSFADVGAGGACEEYVDYDVEAEAVRLARQDGFCSGGGHVETFADASVWNCVYSPTYNDDWHDDVVCSNGAEQQRPSLREWDNFVTEAEIMESAREYEAELNRR
jgi:hypothetical protein